MQKAAGILIAFLIGIAFIGVKIRRPSSTYQAPSAPSPPAEAPPHSYGYQVVHEYPHDPDAFTQGLIYNDGFLYESTGLRGRSSIRKNRLETGEIVQRREVVRENREIAENKGWLPGMDSNHDKPKERRICNLQISQRPRMPQWTRKTTTRTPSVHGTRSSRCAPNH